MMAEHQSKYFEYTLTVPGFSQNGIRYATNTVCTLIDDELELNNEYWVKSVSFQQTKTSGKETTLTLIPKYAYQI